jgi:hypothetical protein
MWIILPEGFLSIVHKAPAGPDELLVRARVRGHLAAVFPDARIIESDSTDYRYRAVVPRAQVADMLVSQVYAVDYGNFKSQVREPKFHDALMSVWHVLEKLQPFGAYGKRRPAARGQRGLFADLRGADRRGVDSWDGGGY